MAGYQYRGAVFDAGGRERGRKPIRHGTTKGQANRCYARELGACDACRAVAVRYNAQLKARKDPRNAVLRALAAFAEIAKEAAA